MMSPKGTHFYMLICCHYSWCCSVCASSIVQFIFYFSSFEIRGNVLRIFHTCMFTTYFSYSVPIWIYISLWIDCIVETRNYRMPLLAYKSVWHILFLSNLRSSLKGTNFYIFI